MESPSFKPLSPSKAPLLPASPERMNQQKLASSPSMPADLSQKHSDVQARIAFINSLSRTGSPTPSQQSAAASAALQRAILGREEAESALARANSQLSEAQSRERRISERLESLLEELQTTRERQAHERTLFEKEVRKARKEAFRASSTLVKLQEELKLSKGEIKGLKDEVRTERDAKEKAKQEAFERAYALAGLTEELQALKDQLRSFQADNHFDALEARTKEMHGDDTRKLAIEGNDDSTSTAAPRRPKRTADETEATQASVDSGARDDETPSKKIRLSRRASNKENQDPEVLEVEEVVIEELKAELKWEQRLRQRAEDMVHFLKMECQFKQCSCRIAESQGSHYVHDKEWDSLYNEQQVIPLAGPVPQPVVSEGTLASTHSSLESTTPATTPLTPRERKGNEMHKELPPPEEPLITFSPTTGTFRALPSPQSHNELHEEPLILPAAPERDASSIRLGSPSPRNDLQQRDAVNSEAFKAQSEMGAEAEGAIHLSQTTLDPPTQDPVYNALVKVNSSEEALISPTEEEPNTTEQHNVKTVPLLPGDTQHRNHAAIIPGTPITREEALAQIRARRGRAKSMIKRSASASESTVRAGGLGVTPMRGTKRIPRHADTRSEPDVYRRDITAPGRL
jgi:predicted  nucleic acid-binding Zn-ribbon protein